jgi:ribosomal protein S21
VVVGQKNNITVAADGFKRQWLMAGHYSTIKRRRAANPTKKRRKKHGGFQDGGASFIARLRFGLLSRVSGPVFMPGHGARRALSELAIQTIISPGPQLSGVVKAGVVVGKSRRFAVLNVLAAQHGGGALKIVHAPGGLALSKGMGNGDGAVGFEAGRPKSVVEMDGGERGGPDGVILRRRAGRRQIEAKNDSERNGKKTTTGECGFHGDTLI